MSQKDLFNSLQKSCHIEHQQITMLLNALSRLMAQAGVEQVPVTLPGLGTFTSHKHPEYIKDDPSTGQQTLYPPRITYRMQTEDLHADHEQLERQLAENAKTTTDESHTFITALVQTILSGLSKGEEVEVKGLGSFRVINSNQGDIQRVAYTPDEQMRQQVNAPFNCFEPVVINPSAEHVMVDSDDDAENAVEVASLKAKQEEPAVPKPKVEERKAPEPKGEEKPEPQPKGEEKTKPELKPYERKALKAQDDANNQKEEKKSSPSKQKTTPDFYGGETYSNVNIGNRVLLGILILAIVIGMGYVIHRVLNMDYDYAQAREEYVYHDPMETADRAEAAFFGTEEPEPKFPEPAAVASSKAETPASDVKPSTPIKASDSANVTPQPTAEPVVEPVPSKPARVDSSDIKGRLKDASGKYVTHKLQPGEHLTKVALDRYGEKWFWYYIYEVNRDRLNKPNVVPSNIELYLPDPTYFGIDANDSTSIREAKNKAARLLKGE